MTENDDDDVAEWWSEFGDEWRYQSRNFGFVSLPGRESVPMADLRMATLAEIRWQPSPPSSCPSTLWDRTTPTSVGPPRFVTMTDRP